MFAMKFVPALFGLNLYNALYKYNYASHSKKALLLINFIVCYERSKTWTQHETHNSLAILIRNIVAKTFENCYMFPRMFPSLSTLGNIVEETYENCCFLECFPVICPPWETMFRKHLRFAVSSNVSKFVHPGKHC